MILNADVLRLSYIVCNDAVCVCVAQTHSTLPQPGAADTAHSEGTRAAASSGLSGVGRVGGVVGMLGV